MEIAGFALKSPRRPAHRPTFDVLERRILPTLPVQVVPLADGPSSPLSPVSGSDGDLWLIAKGGGEVDRVAADGTVATIPIGRSEVSAR